MALDNFGKLRTAQPFTTFNYYPSLSSDGATNFDEDIWVGTVSGTGAIAYSSATNVITLTGSSSGDAVLRSTKLTMEYQPGKSRLSNFTAVMLSRAVSGGESLTSRVGIYNLSGTTPSEGHYFQTDGTNLQWVEVLPGPTSTVVNQASWNYDTFDGTGPSGLTLTIANMRTNMLFVIDEGWLGVSTTRCGFLINNIIYYAHTFNHSSLSAPYSLTPRMKLNYQLITTTLTGGSIALSQICCTTIMEGGYFPLGRRISVATPITGISTSAASTKYVLLALRINSSYPNGVLKFINLSYTYPAGTAAKWGRYELQLISTVGNVGAITGSLTYTRNKDAISEFAAGNGSQTVTTDGYILTSGFSIQSSTQSFDGADFETLLTRTNVSQYDTLVMTGSANSATTETFLASLDFIEIS